MRRNSDEKKYSQVNIYLDIISDCELTGTIYNNSNSKDSSAVRMHRNWDRKKM